MRLYKYILRLVKFLSRLPKETTVQEIVKQLTRSGTSIGANYFEACVASSKKDFQNFFYYALKSANETRFWLGLLRDAKLILKDSESECNWLLQETKEIANILASSILTMKRRK